MHCQLQSFYLVLKSYIYKTSDIFFLFALQPSKMKLLNIMIIPFKVGGMN